MSEEGDYRHKLIQEEFREVLTNSEINLPDKVDAVVVLSAPPSKGAGGELIEESPENVARIKYGILIIRQIMARDRGIKPEEVTSEMLKGAPQLILNGFSNQIKMMQAVSQRFGYPEDGLLLADAGSKAVANTRTQFEVMRNNPRLSGKTHLVLITTSYHVLRASKTASKNLGEGYEVTTLGVPLSDFPVNVFTMVRGEVGRIERYSLKGDITR